MLVLPCRRARSRNAFVLQLCWGFGLPVILFVEPDLARRSGRVSEMVKPDVKHSLRHSPRLERSLCIATMTAPANIDIDALQGLVASLSSQVTFGATRGCVTLRCDVLLACRLNG